MKTDTVFDGERELTLVRNWWIECHEERTTLARVTAELSSESLADEDIREHLQSRLRALERDQQKWHALAVGGWCRRYWAAIGQEARHPWVLP